MASYVGARYNSIFRFALPAGNWSINETKIEPDRMMLDGLATSCF